jgi:hypothetical protein
MTNILAIIFLLFFVGCGGDSHQAIIDNIKADSPQGWLGYCESYGCESVEIKGYGDLQRVFNPLQDNFTYVPDIEESWDILQPDNQTGDCDDFAVTLRCRLIESGFDRSFVRLACCYLNNEPHLVCIVEVNGGSLYVCDDSGINEYDDFDVGWSSILDETESYWIKL